MSKNKIRAINPVWEGISYVIMFFCYLFAMAFFIIKYPKVFEELSSFLDKFLKKEEVADLVFSAIVWFIPMAILTLLHRKICDKLI